MKKAFIILSILLCMTFFLTGCGRSLKITSDNQVKNIEGEINDSEGTAANDASEESGDSQDVSEDTEVVNSSDMKTITEFSDYWTGLYDGNEEAINAYEGMPIMELLYPGMCFLTGIQYDLLNLENKDGRFEGDLMLAGYPAFVEKNGSKYTFGYEEVRKEDGFSENQKAGDKIVESGNCNLAAGYYYSEDYTKRGEAMIGRTVNELKVEDDGSVSAFVLEGVTVNYSNEEELSNTFTFVRNGKGRYDFVVARGQLGTDFDVPSLEADMTKEKAIEMFEAAGCTVESSGGIIDGVYTLD